MRASSAKCCTVYHTVDEMSTKFAQRLFDPGFKDVDHCVPSVNGGTYCGSTPFLRACRKEKLELADWFAERGARSRIDLQEFS